MPDEELPDWLQQLRPASEPQPEQALPPPEKETELALPTEPLEAPAKQADQITPDLPAEMEDMEWLRELEQATISEPPPIEPEPIVPPPVLQTPEAEQVTEKPAAARFEPPTLVTPETPPEPAVAEPEPAEQALVQAQDIETPLAIARARLSEGALDDSAQEYERLVQEPELASELIQELEQAVQTHPEHPALQRVLGDAYMRTGDLQKALQAYRQALSKL
jgi:tetratricopeptide (TPR) repeat protein